MITLVLGGYARAGASSSRSEALVSSSRLAKRRIGPCFRVAISAFSGQ
jgi:hypothetical protein